MINTSLLIFFTFGIIVLILIQTFAYKEHILYEEKESIKKNKKINEENKLIEYLNPILENKNIYDKECILISYDYNIEFKNISNSDKIDKIEDICKLLLKFNKISVFKNTKGIKKVLQDTLERINESVKNPNENQTLVFLWICSISTKILKNDDNTIEGGISLENEMYSESDFKQIFQKYTNIKFICGFEPCNDLFCPQLQIQSKTMANSLYNMNVEKSLFIGKTKNNDSILPLPYNFKTEKQRYPFIQVNDFKLLLNHKLDWNYNLNVEKLFPFDKFIWCFSSVNLTNIFIAYLQIAGPSMGLNALLTYFESHDVIQYLSKFPNEYTSENVFHVS